jgi:hypothetical protein
LHAGFYERIGTAIAALPVGNSTVREDSTGLKQKLRRRFGRGCGRNTRLS